MHDKNRMDGAEFNRCKPRYLTPGDIIGSFGLGFESSAQTLFDSPYLAITLHILFDAVVVAPVNGSVTVWALIRDEHGEYRRCDAVQHTAKEFPATTEGFSVSFPNGADGVVIANSTDISLLNTTMRVSGVPTNTREAGT